jgi:hypothetical protein
MNTDLTPLRISLSDFFGSVVTQVRAAFAVGVVSEEGAQTPEDQSAARNSADRFICDGPGYLTKNGYGSLEVGAAED